MWYVFSDLPWSWVFLKLRDILASHARKAHVLILNAFWGTKLLTRKPPKVPFPAHVSFQLSSEHARLLRSDATQRLEAAIIPRNRHLYSTYSGPMARYGDRLPADLKHVHFKLRPLSQNRWPSQKSHSEYLEAFGEVVGIVARKAPGALISISSTSSELEPTLRACEDRIMAKSRCANGDTHCTQSSNELLEFRPSTVEGLQERRITWDPFNRASIRAASVHADSTEACPQQMSQRLKYRRSQTKPPLSHCGRWPKWV